MKRILILGTGNAQADAILIARELGYMVYACSYNTAGKATSLADKFELINITDTIKVEEFVFENNIDILYSVGSDLALPTACAVSEKLSLPSFVSFKTAQTCLNKDLLRELLGHDSLGTIKYQVLTDKTDKINLSYPFMIKPVDSQGQRGVRLVNNSSDYTNHFDSTMNYSSVGKIIAEEYVEGIEVSVNTYLYNGETVFFMVTDRISWDQHPGGIIHKHLYPSVVSGEVKKAIYNLTRTILKKLNIANGPAYFQIKIKNGKPVIIEATPRLDGCHLWRLIKHATGINLIEMSLKHLQRALPKPETLISPVVADSYSLEFLCETPGSLVDYGKYETNKADYKEWYYKSGEKVMPINGYYEKIGYIITKMNPHSFKEKVLR